MSSIGDGLTGFNNTARFGMQGLLQKRGQDQAQSRFEQDLGFRREVLDSENRRFDITTGLRDRELTQQGEQFDKTYALDERLTTLKEEIERGLLELKGNDDARKQGRYDAEMEDRRMRLLADKARALETFIVSDFGGDTEAAMANPEFRAAAAALLPATDTREALEILRPGKGYKPAGIAEVGGRSVLKMLGPDGKEVLFSRDATEVASNPGDPVVPFDRMSPWQSVQLSLASRGLTSEYTREFLATNGVDPSQVRGRGPQMIAEGIQERASRTASPSEMARRDPNTVRAVNRTQQYRDAGVDPRLALDAGQIEVDGRGSSENVAARLEGVRSRNRIAEDTAGTDNRIREIEATTDASIRRTNDGRRNELELGALATNDRIERDQLYAEEALAAMFPDDNIDVADSGFENFAEFVANRSPAGIVLQEMFGKFNPTPADVLQPREGETPAQTRARRGQVLGRAGRQIWNLVKSDPALLKKLGPGVEQSSAASFDELPDRVKRELFELSALSLAGDAQYFSRIGTDAVSGITRQGINEMLDRYGKAKMAIVTSRADDLDSRIQQPGG